MTSRELDAATLGELLSADHAKIRNLLDDFLEAVNANQWAAADLVFTDFERLVDRHLVFEETRVFPLFKEHPELSPGIALATMLEQHEDIRKTLSETGIGLQLHQIRASAMQQLAEVIDKHATAEDAWAEAVLEAIDKSADSATIMGRLRALVRERIGG